MFDGHGQSGDMVAEYLMTKLPDMLRKELPGARGSKTSLAKMLKSAFLETNSHLNSTPIDTSLSGSTCCSVLLLDNAIVTANVGDSRCIAAYKSTSGDTVKYTAKALTIDHKPDLPQEKARIIGRGGRVAPWAGSDLDHIYRVWLRDEDTPGIGAARCARGVAIERARRAAGPVHAHPTPLDAAWRATSSYVALVRRQGGSAGRHHRRA